MCDNNEIYAVKEHDTYVYVVYVYVDYRKEIGTRIVRVYKDKQMAIEFAKDISIERNPDQDNDEEDDKDEDEIRSKDLSDNGKNNSDYCITRGTEYDNRLGISVKDLSQYGVEDKYLWYLRVAVDKVLMF